MADQVGLKRKRSVVWSYFEKSDEGNGICDLCGDRIQTSGNTSNLFKVKLSSVLSINSIAR